jgi:hypothetical protein
MRHHPGAGTRAVVFAISLLAAFLLMGSTGVAAVPALRRIATSTASFASDGSRYAAWEVRGRAGIYLLDTRSGRTSKVPTSCSLDSGAPAAGGRFLAWCGDSEQKLLDARTDAFLALPKPPPHEYGSYGPIWTGVGVLYLVGLAGSNGQCVKTKRHESCTALYDIATGTMSEVAESQMPDPDLPGAPSLCRALRRKAYLRTKFEFLEGSGPLGPLGGGFSFRSGLFAHLEQIGEAPVRHIRIARCHGSPTVVQVRLEPHERNSEAHPYNVEIGGGFLTWDTGNQSSSFDQEEEYGLRATGGLSRGTLSAYNLSTHRLLRWKLPSLRLDLSGLGRKRLPVGVFGYSAHAGNMGFWIAARRLSCENIKGECGETDSSDIYATRLP